MVRWCSGYHIVLIDESSCSSYARVLGSSPSRTIIYAFLLWFFLSFVAQPIPCFSTVVIFAVGEKMGGYPLLGMGTDGGRRGVDHSISAWANLPDDMTCPSKNHLSTNQNTKEVQTT